MQTRLDTGEPRGYGLGKGQVEQEGRMRCSRRVCRSKRMVAISKRIVVRSSTSVQVQKKCNEVQKKCCPFMSHACHCFWKCCEPLTFFLTFDTVDNPLRLPGETASERPKVLRTRQLFTFLTWTCASRRNSMHFFDISTSKSGLSMVCFVHFDFQMCFAPEQ